MLTPTLYKDIETDKLREIDVFVHRFSDISQPVIVSVSCHIECKSSTGKPWILFASKVNREKGNLLVRGVKNQASQPLFVEALMGRANNISTINSLPIFQTDIIGHGITQAHTEGKDIPYKAVMSAVNSCQARVELFDSPKYTNLPKAKHIVHICEFPIPTVVIEDKLFECRINDLGDPVVKEVDYGLLDWKGAGSPVFVPIVTKPKLLEFANHMDESIKCIIEFHECNMDTLVEYSKILVERNKQENPI